MVTFETLLFRAILHNFVIIFFITVICKFVLAYEKPTAFKMFNILTTVFKLQ